MIQTGRHYWLRKFPTAPGYQHLVYVTKVYANGDCRVTNSDNGQSGLCDQKFLHKYTNEAPRVHKAEPNTEETQDSKQAA